MSGERIGGHDSSRSGRPRNTELLAYALPRRNTQERYLPLEWEPVGPICGINYLQRNDLERASQVRAGILFRGDAPKNPPPLPRCICTEHDVAFPTGRRSLGECRAGGGSPVRLGRRRNRTGRLLFWGIGQTKRRGIEGTQHGHDAMGARRRSTRGVYLGQDRLQRRRAR